MKRQKQSLAVAKRPAELSLFLDEGNFNGLVALIAGPEAGLSVQATDSRPATPKLHLPSSYLLDDLPPTSPPEKLASNQQRYIHALVKEAATYLRTPNRFGVIDYMLAMRGVCQEAVSLLTPVNPFDFRPEIVWPIRNDIIVKGLDLIGTNTKYGFQEKWEAGAIEQLELIRRFLWSTFALPIHRIGLINVTNLELLNRKVAELITYCNRSAKLADDGREPLRAAELRQTATAVKNTYLNFLLGQANSSNPLAVGTNTLTVKQT